MQRKIVNDFDTLNVRFVSVFEGIAIYKSIIDCGNGEHGGFLIFAGKAVSAAYLFTTKLQPVKSVLNNGLFV